MPATIRRRLAVGAIATIASSVALNGNYMALAAPVPSSSSSPAAPAAVAEVPGLTVDGLPSSIPVGAAPAEFTLTVTNHTAADLALYALLHVSNEGDSLDNTAISLDYQNPQPIAPATPSWAAATEAPGLDNYRLLGPLDGGEVSPAGRLVVTQGATLSIKVRIAFPKDFPLGPAVAVFLGYWAPLNAEGEVPEGVQGTVLAGTPGFFSVVAAPKPSPSASPSASGSPSPSASDASPGPTQSTATKAATPPPAAVTFPVQPPKPITLPMPADAGLKAKVAAVKARTTATKSSAALATTGGGSDATPIAIAGAAVLAAGAGTLVLLRRRKSGAHS